MASSFIDIEPGSWYEAAVDWAKEKGIVNGYEDGRFRPDAQVTREQAFSIFYRYAQYKEYDTSSSGDSLDEFSDKEEISPWALDSLRWGVDAGLITGRGNSRLAPRGSITRAEAAALIQRVVMKLGA